MNPTWGNQCITQIHRYLLFPGQNGVKLAKFISVQFAAEAAEEPPRKRIF